jgi:glycosyltransferase involved in cell wall biosynthesis
MNRTTTPLRVGYIVRSFPRLSQTFILNEVLALEENAVQVRIFSCINPREAVVQPQLAALQARIDYLDEAQQRPRWLILWEHLLILLIAPQRYLRTLCYVMWHREFDEGYTASSRYSCFLQAVYLTHLLWRERSGPGAIDHLHAHFAHDPTLIAQLVHRLTGIAFTFTAHARDIYQIPPSALAERIKQAQAVITCCALNVDYCKTVVSPAHHAKLRVIHNGINLDDFQPTPEYDGTATAPLILSASRLVEKKGHLDLLAACQQLKASGQPFRCIIYGEGPVYQQLTAQIQQQELGDCVTLAGVYTHQELRRVMPQAAIFALTPFVTPDGDRDGVPTVLAEAMACGVPVVSTTVAGIPELVAHGQNGLLATPHQIDEIAAGLRLLLTDPAKRQALGAAARHTIVQEFNLQTGARQLTDLYRAIAHPQRAQVVGGVQ